MWELSSALELVMVETMSFSHSTSLSSHPLFSSIITLFFIIFIFCPQLFPVILFSPVLIITAILLIFLLRLGATQRNLTQSSCNSENNESQSKKGTALPEEDEEFTATEPESSYVPDVAHDWNSCFEERFIEWNVRAPLDVIYEDYEGEEEEEEEEDHPPTSKDSKTEMHHPNIDTERHPSLSMYYPESDSDSSTDGEYTTIGGGEEDERDDLIEICLVWDRRESGYQVEEENWIEIDISPTRNGGDAGDQWGIDSEFQSTKTS